MDMITIEHCAPTFWQRTVARSRQYSQLSRIKPWRHCLTRVLLASGLCVLSLGVQAERIKDLASIAGVRDNPLLGYGLVVGLDGTGDQTGSVSFTEQSLRLSLIHI